jgi:hypothetical protein
MAALNVFREVGKIADADFIAMEVLPIMWAFSLGPLLDLQQVNIIFERVSFQPANTCLR